MKAVILAGGYGKRLRPLTESTPKPLLSVAGKGIIEWQIAWLRHYGVSEVIVCAGYLKEKVIEKLGNGSRYGVKIDYAIEEEPLGTGGALKNAEHLLRNEENFIALNGDILTDFNPLELMSDLDEGCVGSMALVPLPSPFGIVNFDSGSMKIKSFVEKPRIREYWINAGVYAFKPEIFDHLPNRGNIEKIVFPKLAERGKLKAHPFESCLWMSIDSHKDLEEASRIIPNLGIFRR